MPFDLMTFRNERPSHLKDSELQRERETLETVARILRREIAPLATDGGTVGFHMAESCTAKEHSPVQTEWECGTVACIGGHAWLVENPGDVDGASRHVNAVDDSANPVGLRLLYWNMRSMNATPLQAAAAIDNYLASGDPRWSYVLASVRPDKATQE